MWWDWLSSLRSSGHTSRRLRVRRRSGPVNVAALESRVLLAAPVFQPPTSFTISENRPVGYVVGQVNATDADGDNVSYSIVGGDPNAQFAIDANTGVITVAKATINFEATPQFTLQVQAVDDGMMMESTTQAVAVTITDLNEPPVFLAPTTFTISENRPIGHVVGDVNTFDPEGNAVTYSIVGGDLEGQFAIDANTGVITVARGTVNFEVTPQYLLQVQAQDDGTPANSRTQTVTVNVNDLNEPPVFLAPVTFTMSENRPVGYVVGDVNAIDPEGGPVTFAIVGGDGKQQFQIDPNTGVITVKKATIDFESNPFYLLQVQAADSGVPAATRTQTVRVNVVNLNEAPVFVGPSTFHYAENQAVGSFVGDVNAIDPENNALTYGIVGGNPDDKWAIDATTGVITLAKGSINFEAATQFTLDVRVQDNGNPSQSRVRTYTIQIVDVNEPPIFVPPTTFNVLENRSVGHVVGTVQVVDPENRPVTFTITGGDPNGQFAINPNTGTITVAKATIDFETKSQYELQILAVDTGSPSQSATQTVTINVQNLNEAPVFLLPTTFTVAENTINGVVVGTVKTFDPEGNAVTYSLVGGNTNNAFTINPTAGEIIVANRNALDFETTPQFLLQVRAQDNGSPANSRTQTITVNLTNVAGAGAPAPASRARPGESRPSGATGEQVVAKAVSESVPNDDDAPGFALSDDEYDLWLTDALAADVVTAE